MNYRCKHTVEAMRWTDTDENRELFAAWLERHDVMFETKGSTIMLAECGHVEPDEWLVYMDGEFVAMEDEAFADQYEAA